MTTAASWRRTSLLDDLLTTIENNPNSIDARKLLIEQYEAIGWDLAAAAEARTVIKLYPNAQETNELLTRYDTKATTESVKKKQHRQSIKSDNSETYSALDVQQLSVGYGVVQDDAKNLLRELTVLAELAPEVDCKDRIAELTALSEGRFFSATRGKIGATGDQAKDVKRGVLRSARSVAASMKADHKHALDIAYSDLEAALELIHRTEKSHRDRDAQQEAIRKRADAVKAALPAGLAHIPLDALMHIEHEKLKRTYHNTETMFGDPVAKITREDFWVSADGYAWDMDELVQAVQAAKGAMRNPLTKEPFSTDDVAAIIRHPKGKQLAALEVEQKQLKKGVRQQTIDMLRSMSGTLLLDMSENSQPSHEAVDAWLLYVATLPAAEQETIDKLMVPAVDSHTSQPFDDTVGDSVRDAKANKLCFHKAGDFLQQAAEFLEKSKAG